MIRVGIIGMGFMGGVHFHAWNRLDAACVVAVCDTHPIQAKAKQGNIDAGAQRLDLEGVALHTDLAEMLAAEQLDAVSITLPTHLHKDATLQCLAAGVHVLCEKPMALNTADCQAMIDAADTAGKQLMIAHCVRFWPEYAWLKEAVANEPFGPTRIAEFERLTHAPTWNDDSWFSDEGKSGGIALDLHIHDLDLARYLFGEPNEIQSHATDLPNGITGHIQTVMKYDQNLNVTAAASWLMPESFGFRMAFKLLFENGSAEFDGKQLVVYPANGEPFTPALPSGDGYQREVEHFAAVIAGEETHRIIPPADAAESVRLTLEATAP